MAPSGIASESDVTSTPLPEENNAISNGTEVKASAGDKLEVQEQPKEANGSKEAAKVAEVAQSEKLSGAELKKRAKADKAARRAQGKQEKQAPPPAEAAAPTAKKLDVGKEAAKKGNAAAVPSTPGSKSQHKRTGSTNTMHQRPMVSRPAQSQVAPPAPQPKKENKNVALFGHLYGQPRRTTIAGAGKDVHPAVLALGLQMSNYVICGSNARCVATLLVFKRVITSLQSTLRLAHNPLGYRIIHHPSAKLAPSSSCFSSLPSDRISGILPATFGFYGKCYQVAEG